MTPERRKALEDFFEEVQGRATEEQEYPVITPLSSSEWNKMALEAGFTEAELDEWYETDS